MSLPPRPIDDPSRATIALVLALFLAAGILLAEALFGGLR